VGHWANSNFKNVQNFGRSYEEGTGELWGTKSSDCNSNFYLIFKKIDGQQTCFCGEPFRICHFDFEIFKIEL
jgi:hypothetical protein